MAAAAIVMAADEAPAQAPPHAAGAAGAEYRVELDPWARPEMGVVGLTTAGRLALAGFDVLAATWEGRCAEPSLWCGAARAFELVLIDLPVAHYAQVLPHELFGHGGRARELGLSVSYKLGLPVPYAPVFGPLEYRAEWGERGRPISLDELMLLTLGGLEVEALQERHLAYTSFRSRGLRHGDALIYLLGPLHLLTYTARRGSALNDVRQFEDIVAQKHGVDGCVRGAGVCWASVRGEERGPAPGADVWA